MYAITNPSQAGYENKITDQRRIKLNVRKQNGEFEADLENNTQERDDT